jgi:hypothetical protein
MFKKIILNQNSTKSYDDYKFSSLNNGKIHTRDIAQAQDPDRRVEGLEQGSREIFPGSPADGLVPHRRRKHNNLNLETYSNTEDKLSNPKSRRIDKQIACKNFQSI